MNCLVRLTPLVLATASLVGCGSSVSSSNLAPEKPGDIQQSSATLLLAAGPHTLATYRLEKDSARLTHLGSSPSETYALPGTKLSVFPGANKIVKTYTQQAYRSGSWDTSVEIFSFADGELLPLQRSWVPGRSFGITGSGKFAVAVGDYESSLRTFAIQETGALLEARQTIAGFSSVTADAKSEVVAAIAPDTAGDPSLFGHGTLRLFRLDNDGYPLRLVDTRVEPGQMLWNGNLIFIVNRDIGPRRTGGYAVSAVHVVRDQGTIALEGHPGVFWFIGDSPQIVLSPTNDYMVAGSEKPGLYVYKLDPRNGAVLNWPGVPLAGYEGDLSVTFDRDNTLVLAASDSTSNETKLYRLSLSAAGEILTSQFLGSHNGQTSALVLLDSSFARDGN